MFIDKLRTTFNQIATDIKDLRNIVHNKFNSPNIELTALQDLNDIKAFGTYYQNKNANATLANNYPATIAGSLVVTGSAYGVMQIYFDYTGKYIFRRNSASGGTWTGWTQNLFMDKLATDNINLNNGSLVFSNGISDLFDYSGNNLDAMWHDDSNNSFHLTSDTTYKDKANSGLFTGSQVRNLKSDNCWEIKNAVSLMHKGNSVNSSYILKLPFKKNSLAMVHLTIRGFKYASSTAYEELHLSFYLYNNGVFYAPKKTLATGVILDSVVKGGFDSNGYAHIFFGEGKNKYYSMMTVDAMVMHGDANVRSDTFIKAYTNPVSFRLRVREVLQSSSGGIPELQEDDGNGNYITYSDVVTFPS